MLSVTHGKHISIWELEKPREIALEKYRLVGCSGLFPFPFLCLPSKQGFTFVKCSPDRGSPLLQVAAEGRNFRERWFHPSPCSWRSVSQLRTCLQNGAFTELLILEVSFDHGLIPFHGCPLKGRQLFYIITWGVLSYWLQKSKLGFCAGSSAERVWEVLALGLCWYHSTHPGLAQSVCKSTLKEPKTGMQREGRACFFPFTRKCLCVKSC